MTINILRFLKFKLVKSNFELRNFILIIFHLIREEVIGEGGKLNSEIDFPIKHRYI